MPSCSSSRSMKLYTPRASGQETRVPKVASLCELSCHIAWTQWRTRTLSCKSDLRRPTPSAQLLLLTIQMEEETPTIASSWCRARLICSVKTQSSSRHDLNNLTESHTVIVPRPQTSSATASRPIRPAPPWPCATTTLRLKRPTTRKWKSMSLSRTVCPSKSSHSDPYRPIRPRKPRHTREWTIWMRESKTLLNVIHHSSKCLTVSRCRSDYGTLTLFFPSQDW